jgi:hypothetical protein
MPSYLCKCNKRIDYTSIPADPSYQLVADKDVVVQDDIVTCNATWSEATQVLRCPYCGRLWVFWDGFHKAPTEYLNVGVDTRPA